MLQCLAKTTINVTINDIVINFRTYKIFLIEISLAPYTKKKMNSFIL